MRASYDSFRDMFVFNVIEKKKKNYEMKLIEMRKREMKQTKSFDYYYYTHLPAFKFNLISCKYILRSQ